MRKKGDVTLNAGRQAGLSISGTDNLLGNHKQSSLGFTEKGPKKRIHPVSISSLGENALLMPEVRGE